MGQVLKRIIDESQAAQQESNDPIVGLQQQQQQQQPVLSKKTFPDLAELPPELSLAVLSHLNATDLCLAACVWQHLAQDDILWQGLCKTQWGYVTAYRRRNMNDVNFYRKLYLQLDEGTLTFNADASMGMQYFFNKGLLNDEVSEIAQFFHSTRSLNSAQLRLYLDSRRDVLNKLIELHNYRNQFLPNALRKLFTEIQAPNERGNYLQYLLEKFSARFCECNPQLRLTPDTVYILCFSLILLSVDLCSPHVKNKMSKREFIRNIRNAVQSPDDELAGHLYDNIYLVGHVAPKTVV